MSPYCCGVTIFASIDSSVNQLIKYDAHRGSTPFQVTIIGIMLSYTISLVISSTRRLPQSFS